MRRSLSPLALLLLTNPAPPRAPQYSTEKPRADIGLLPLPEDEFQKGKVDELSAIANFRVRILPVLGPLPAMVSFLSLFLFLSLSRRGELTFGARAQFGNAAATYVLQSLAGFPMEPLPVKYVPPSVTQTSS